MKNYAVKQTPHNLGFEVSFIETGRKYEVEDLRQTVNVINLRANLCFTWVSALLDRLGLGQTIIGKIARSLPIPNPGNHKRYFIGGLLLYLGVAMIVSSFYALLATTKTIAFKTRFIDCLGTFVAVYGVIAAALYGLYYVRGLINKHLSSDFWRTITISATDMQIVVNSVQEGLRVKSWGYDYHPKVIRISEVTGIEENHIHAFSPSAGQMTTPEMILETNNAYEVSIFTNDGKRHVLMRNVCGPDTARELRTKLASLVHKVQSVIPHIQRLHTANAYDEATEQRLRNMLYGSNTPSTPQHTTTPFYQPIPEADRL